MVSNKIVTQRVKRLRTQLVSSDIDCAFITKKEHIFYYTGLHSLQPHEREAFLIITPNQLILYHSPFVSPPSQSSCLAIAMSAAYPLQHVIKTYLQPHTSIGFEQSNMTVGEFERLKTQLKKQLFVPIDTNLESQRIAKDDDELASSKKACRITAKILRWAKQYTLSHTDDPLSEIQLKNMINQQLEAAGCTNAFPTIVAFDKHTASPHHVPTTNKYHKNSIILIDMGAKYDEYCADMTRTWMLGKPSTQFLTIEKIVKSAHDHAVNAASQSHATGKMIDDAARRVISQAGYGDAFIHTTGHGVGLEEHEAPHIGPQNTESIPQNAIITVEPGIYIHNKFGYRHENTFVKTKTGLAQLTV